jgi:hypothetical protein
MEVLLPVSTLRQGHIKGPKDLGCLVGNNGLQYSQDTDLRPWCQKIMDLQTAGENCATRTQLVSHGALRVKDFLGQAFRLISFTASTLADVTSNHFSASTGVRYPRSH